MSQPSKTRARLLSLLRLCFALALLAFVASMLPWKDRLNWVAGKSKLEVSGKIEGKWRGESIEFEAAPGSVLPAGWPDQTRAALERGERVRVERSPDEASAPHYEWQPAMQRVFREIESRWLWLAMGALLVSAVMSVTRWWRMLALAGCPTSWLNALRLTFLGFFFNLVVPGLTGGDVIKAVMVVRENPQRRADALVTVIVDRVLGLIVLAGLASLVVLMTGDMFHEMRWPVVLCFLAMLVGTFVFLHPLPRRALGISRLLDKLPQRERLKSIERALLEYAKHPGEMLLAVVLSIVNHCGIAAALMAIGTAFGAQMSFPAYLGIMAIANTVSSLPIAPSGLGVGEVLIGYLFHLLGSTQPLGVAVSVTYRLLTVALNLAGGLFLLLPGGKEVREEFEHEQQAG
ncbi:MAG: flippase-like domain-containing protein [Planctomycetes bacterium]|nr:flippase-like domain-containing protein [Planctomycetota bacterium]